MMKTSYLALAVMAAGLIGCAQQGKVLVRATEVDTIHYKNEAELVAVGPVQMNPLGPVFYKKDGERCSELDLMIVASKTYPGLSDVINIRMEETSETNSVNMKQVTTYSCKYYGLAVSFSPLKKETLDAYLLLKGIRFPAVNKESEPYERPVPVKEFDVGTEAAAEVQ
jgi:hypothetical protein